MIICQNNLKPIAASILPILYRFPPYRFFYDKHVKRLMKKNEIKPDKISIEGCNYCPFNCSFCFHPQMKRTIGVMEINLFKDIVTQAKEWGINEIDLQGFGEPLYDPLFFERVKYCQVLKIPKIHTNINAIAVNGKIHQLLESGLTEIFISCNADGEKNVRYLLNQRKGTFPKIYLSFIKGYTKPYKNIKADGISISYPHTWGGKLFKFNGIKEPCRLLWSGMFINWKGEVYPCCMDYETEYITGNANNTKLKKIWEANILWRDGHKEGWLTHFPICEDCGYNCASRGRWLL